MIKFSALVFPESSTLTMECSSTLKISGPFVKDGGISLRMASIAYPQANGQIKASKKTIMHGLKALLEKAKGKWVDELPSISCAYRMTNRVSMGETPFILVYGTYALIPVKVALNSS